MSRDEIAQAMQDTAGNSWGNEAHFQRFAALVAAAEREACAKVAEEYMRECEGASFGIGEAIRERGDT